MSSIGAKIALSLAALEAQAKTYIASIYNNDIKPLVAKEAAAFKPLVKATEQEVLTVGPPIALSFMSSAMSGTQKMSAAIPALINQLGSAGKSIAVADAQAALQIIVGQVKDAANAAEASLASGG